MDGCNNEKCPYIVNQAEYEEEIQIFDLIDECREQMRIGEGNFAVGVEQSAVLNMAKLRGYNVSVIMDLLPAASSGLAAAWNKGLRDGEQ